MKVVISHWFTATNPINVHTVTEAKRDETAAQLRSNRFVSN